MTTRATREIRLVDGSTTCAREFEEAAGLERVPGDEWWLHCTCLTNGGVFIRWANQFEFIVAPGGDVITARMVSPSSTEAFQACLLGVAFSFALIKQGIEPLHAAMLKINPMTAWRLLHDYVQLQKGDWLIQNAANSAAGRAVIQIAHELGYKTINVVRRAELIEELRTEGADIVIVDGENLRDEVKTATSGAQIRLGLNAVGGDSALRVANCLAPGSTMVTYGAMSLQPLKIPNGLLIFKDLRFRGIWINKWYDNATPAQRMEAFQSLFEMAKRGLLKTKVEKAYPLSEAKAAVTHAAQGKRSGKIIFKFE